MVVAPAGGVALTQWTVYHLNQLGYPGHVLAVYAEKDVNNFVFRRGYEQLIHGKNVLVVEDILTTGGSVMKVVEAVTVIDGHVLAVAALCNQGGATAEDLGVPELFSLTRLPLQSWTEDECPLCQQGIPVNVVVGRGRDFLIRTAGN